MRRLSIVVVTSAMAAVLFTAVSVADDLRSILERQMPVFPPADTKSSDYCFPDSNIKVVDTSAPVDPAFLNKMKDFGVEVVARYYGYTDDKRPPDGGPVGPFQTAKVITRPEVELLRERGMASIAIFQYLSQNESTFANWNVRADADAKRALELAGEFGQPKKTTIYFGADGDFVHNLDRPCKKSPIGAGNCTEEILNYFTVVSDLVRQADYEVGMYGSGAACKFLTERDLVKHCWLNFSPGHSGRLFGLTSDKTVLHQFAEAKSESEQFKCGRKLDFSRVRAMDFGQFFYGEISSASP